MAKAKKLPSGSWRVRVYAGTDSSGKKIIKSFTSDSKKEAELMAAQFSAQHKEPAAEMTVGKAIDKYIESKTNILSPTTISGYREIRRNKFKGIMDIQLRRLTTEAIQQEINSMAASLSPKSISNAYGLLKPTLSVYAPDINLTQITLPKKQKIIRELPEPAEVINAIRGTDIELPCLLAIWSGMRMSEIRGIKKSDCKDGCIIVHSTLVTVEGRDIEKSQTKTYDSTRITDIPEYLQKLIDEVDTEHLTELTRNVLYKKFIKYQKEAGIDPLIRFHDLRHLNASVMVQLGIPDKYAMERGGWSTTSTLKSVYQHTFSSEREAVNQKINEYFNDIVHSEE